MRRLIVFLVAIATVMLVPISPAHASHMVARWDRPPVVWGDGQWEANVQDAAYYWQDRGFNGYYPPLPYNVGGAYCAGNYTGVITVCTVPRAVLQPYCNKSCDGAAWAYWKPGTNIINGAYILVSNDLSPYRRQQVWRHEMGHALGFVHTTINTCVMREDANVPLGDGCPSDIQEMQAQYPGTSW